MYTPSRADASGILNCIKDALKQVGIEDLLNSECVLGVENFLCWLVVVQTEQLSMWQELVD